MKIRVLGWSLALFILIMPLIAMQFTEEVNWDGKDFALMAGMMVVTGGALELIARMKLTKNYRIGISLSILFIFFLIWAELVVGIFH